MNALFTVLITDRNRYVRELLRRELAAAGYQTATAGNAGEIAARLAQGPPVDAIVLDDDIAGADCAAVVRAIRTHSRTLPVIVHGHGVEEAAAALGEKFTIFVKKNEDLTRLKSAVAGALRHFQPQARPGRTPPAPSGRGPG
jgi:DNA-binding NtrC family response regulator